MFVGEPHNGEIRKTIAGGKVHLLGNPYPSAIDADLFLDLNSTVLGGTLYFWTHNTSPSTAIAGNAMYNYTTNDYATYNKTGGVGGTAAIAGGLPPTRNIGAGQGFFAPASATGGEVIFKNEMRLLNNEVIDNSQFFKLGIASKATNVVEKNRVWLNLTNAEGAFKQTLIGYITGATNDYEGGFDGVSYDGNQYADFYSINQGLNLAIQGRDLAFQENDSVILGYKTTIAGDFKISIDHTDGVLSIQDVFLEDKDLKVFHDLKKAAYAFNTTKGVFNNRFVLRYKERDVIVDEVSEVAVEGVVISTNNKTIAIDAANEIIKAIYIFDFSGKLVYSDTAVNLSNITIRNLSVAHQALIVRLSLENGKKVMKKIIY